jgi:hypothetical protein
VWVYVDRLVYHFVDRSLSLGLFLLAIMLSVLHRLTDSDYPFGIFKLFLSFIELRSLIIILVSSNSCCPLLNYGHWLSLWYLQTLFVLYWITAIDYHFGIFKLFLSFIELRPLIIILVSSNSFCPLLNYGHWLSLWYLQTFLIKQLHFFFNLIVCYLHCFRLITSCC